MNRKVFFSNSQRSKNIFKNWTFSEFELNIFCFNAGNENLVEDLIRNGANVNSQAPNGWSALHMVAWKGHNQIANLLLRNDADINLKTNLGWTAFHTAAFNGKFIWKIPGIYIQFFIKPFNNFTILFIELNIELNSNIHWAQHLNNYCTIFFVYLFTVNSGHKAIVEMLYRKGANINLKTNEGWTALHTAVYKGMLFGISNEQFLCVCLKQDLFALKRIEQLREMIFNQEKRCLNRSLGCFWISDTQRSWH